MQIDLSQRAVSTRVNKNNKMMIFQSKSHQMDSNSSGLKENIINKNKHAHSSQKSRIKSEYKPKIYQSASLSSNDEIVKVNKLK